MLRKLVAEHVENEPGTLMYILHEDAEDDDVLWFYEQYDRQAAFDAHGTSDAMKATRPERSGRCSPAVRS